VNINETDYIKHYGILRKSGRYPWGSSGNQNTRNKDFIDIIDGLKSDGLTMSEIAKQFSTSSNVTTTTELRAAHSIAIAQTRQNDINFAQRLKDKQWSNNEIGKRMSIGESQVRALLKPGANDKARVLEATTDMLREAIDSQGIVDVGGSVGLATGVSRERLAQSIAILEDEGYQTYTPKLPQLTTSHETKYKIMAKPGMSFGDAAKQLRAGELGSIKKYPIKNGREIEEILPPIPVSLSKVAVTYGSEGGAEADGVMYIRPGVAGLDMGSSSYAQVRVQVGPDHYLKGMAVYSDNLPAGKDIVFNTNKEKTSEGKIGAMKSIDRVENPDANNPFGAQISRQIQGRDSNGKPIVTSALNIVNEEGDWNEWSKNLSTQMLSKQSTALARQQLDKSYQSRADDYKEISELTNPAVRKKLLDEFSETTEAASVHMKAASMPKQRTQVLIPVPSMKPTEVYAPNFVNGERVVLIRYPHGGAFEIPELRVNNRNPQAKSLLGQAKDAIGLSAEVAERMSGADFDGDTVLVIPNNEGRVKTQPALEGLKDFDPQRAYPAYKGMKPITNDTMQGEMGKVSNLITDMTIRKASKAELAQAVRHSMVVIDSAKHNLDYKQSAEDNGIRHLKAKYQGGPNKGATTLISRAKREEAIPQRREARVGEGGSVDPKTGKKRYVETGATYVNKKGETVQRKTKGPALSFTDAETLSSGTPMERVYVEHSQKTRLLAEKARLQSLNTPNAVYSPSAAKTYSKEVAQLTADLNVALVNAPRERQAQAVATAKMKARKDSNPEMDKTQEKKLKAQELTRARAKAGAKKEVVPISDTQWKAIQEGAVSHSKLTKVLNNADPDRVRELATPKRTVMMDSTAQTKARAMLNSGATRAEVASALGVSLTTLDTGLE
jgi:hypothetical protein